MGLVPDELEQFRHECEVKDWHRRYLAKVSEHGLDAAKEWMRGILEDISKRRGAAAGERLRIALNELRSADQQAVGAAHPRPPPRRRGRV